MFKFQVDYYVRFREYEKIYRDVNAGGTPTLNDKRVDKRHIVKRWDSGHVFGLLWYVSYYI